MGGIENLVGINNGVKVDDRVWVNDVDAVEEDIKTLYWARFRKFSFLILSDCLLG